MHWTHSFFFKLALPSVTGRAPEILQGTLESVVSLYLLNAHFLGGLPRREEKNKVCWVMMNLQQQICSFLQLHDISSFKGRCYRLDYYSFQKENRSLVSFIQRRRCQAHTQWFSNILWSQRMGLLIMPTVLEAISLIFFPPLLASLGKCGCWEKGKPLFVLSVADMELGENIRR